MTTGDKDNKSFKMFGVQLQFTTPTFVNNKIKCNFNKIKLNEDLKGIEIKYKDEDYIIVITVNASTKMFVRQKQECR